MGGGLIRVAGMAALTVLIACVPAAPPRISDGNFPEASPNAASEPSPRLALDLGRLSDEKPVWEVRPVTPHAFIQDGHRIHIVGTGETGIAIARAYAIPWHAIVDANVLTPPYLLRTGQRLRLPDAVSGSTKVPAQRLQLDIDDLVTGSEPAVAVGSTTPRSTVPKGVARFVWPTAGTQVSRFGRSPAGRVNQGIDLQSSAGAGIAAASDGTVAYVGRGVPGYGGLILVRHEGGWISAYARVARASVAKGDTVRAGQTIGNTSDEALHFELRRARVPVDPLAYLPRR